MLRKAAAARRAYTDIELCGRDHPGCPPIQLDYVGTGLTALVGRDAILLRSEPRQRESAGTERIVNRASLFFESVEELEPIRIEHRGQLARWVRVFHAVGYRGPDVARDSDRSAETDPCLL